MSRAPNVRLVQKHRFWTYIYVLAVNVLTGSGEKKIVLKCVFFDQATSKNNFWKKFFSVRGRLTRSLPSNFPKIIDFHWNFLKLWKAITPSILVVRESFKPFWNPQTIIFLKSDGLFLAISIRKMCRAENVKKVRKARFMTYIYMSWQGTC